MYCCQFPGCKFSTSARNLIDRHHIIPRAMPGSSNKSWNLMWVCPDHHRMIYVPGMKAGHHAIEHGESIVVLGWRESTKGKALYYKSCSEEKSYFYFEDGDKWQID